MVVKLTDLIPQTSQRSAWDVCVHRVAAGWQIRGESTYLHVTFVFPPSAYVGIKNTGTVHDALWNQPSNAKVFRFFQFMSYRAEFSMLARCGDSDGKNLRLCAWSVARLPLLPSILLRLCLTPRQYHNRVGVPSGATHLAWVFRLLFAVEN